MKNNSLPNFEKFILKNMNEFNSEYKNDLEVFISKALPNRVLHISMSNGFLGNLDAKLIPSKKKFTEIFILKKLSLSLG